MSYSMNSGYSGWSMSKRAVAAYEDGEMPKSKWTKSAMLAAIAEALDEEGIELTPEQMQNLEKMTKNDLFDRYFYASSWHHTSKYCNITDFYSVDEGELFHDAQNTNFTIKYTLHIIVGQHELDHVFDSKRELKNYLKGNHFPAKRAETRMWFRGGITYLLNEVVR